MPEPWSIIVHGGAKTIRPERQDANRRGCLEAVLAGRDVLSQGGAAVDAVVAAIQALENDPTFNAGYGSVLNADGEIELDAAIMDGSTLDVGAVGAIRGVVSPIEVARMLLRDEAVLLVGEGALRFAVDKAAQLCNPAALIAPQIMADEASDTVGCVAMDVTGAIAAGTSTGGLSGVRAGRVGDSPIPGCGLYAEDGIGGVSFSGDGEAILRLALAGRLMQDLRTLSPDQGAQEAIRWMPRLAAEAGCIVLGPRGEPGFAHNSTHFAVALADHETEPRAFLRREEWNGG